jgi:hypothetical protein
MGQVWTSDFLAGALILTFILLFFILMWNNTANRWNSSSGFLQMYSAAIFTSDALLTTPGEPANWETLPGLQNATTLGLVNGRNEISNAKIERLVAENGSYESIKGKVGMQYYDFRVSVLSLGGGTVYHRFGKAPPADAESIVIERLGLVNDSIMLVRLEVWG